MKSNYLYIILSIIVLLAITFVNAKDVDSSHQLKLRQSQHDDKMLEKINNAKVGDNIIVFTFNSSVDCSMGCFYNDSSIWNGNISPDGGMANESFVIDTTQSPNGIIQWIQFGGDNSDNVLCQSLTIIGADNLRIDIMNGFELSCSNVLIQDAYVNVTRKGSLYLSNVTLTGSTNIEIYYGSLYFKTNITIEETVKVTTYGLNFLSIKTVDAASTCNIYARMNLYFNDSNYPYATFEGCNIWNGMYSEIPGTYFSQSQLYGDFQVYSIAVDDIVTLTENSTLNTYKIDTYTAGSFVMEANTSAMVYSKDEDNDEPMIRSMVMDPTSTIYFKNLTALDIYNSDLQGTIVFDTIDEITFVNMSLPVFNISGTTEILIIDSVLPEITQFSSELSPSSNLVITFAKSKDKIGSFLHQANLANTTIVLDTLSILTFSETNAHIAITGQWIINDISSLTLTNGVLEAGQGFLINGSDSIVTLNSVHLDGNVTILNGLVQITDYVTIEGGLNIGPLGQLSIVNTIDNQVSVTGDFIIQSKTSTLTLTLPTGQTNPVVSVGGTFVINGSLYIASGVGTTFDKQTYLLFESANEIQPIGSFSSLFVQTDSSSLEFYYKLINGDNGNLSIDFSPASLCNGIKTVYKETPETIKMITIIFSVAVAGLVLIVGFVLYYKYKKNSGYLSID